MTHLCLVRHGQTDWNLEGRYQGQSDVPLNETGIDQAHTLAEMLNKYEFSVIFSSDLQRASRTAVIIAEHLNLRVQLDPRLREINQGEWEGMHVDVISNYYADLWHQRLIDPANARPPGGETIGEVATRVYQALDDIATQYAEEAVLLVAHGLSIATILCKVRGISIGHAYEVIPKNANPLWVEWDLSGNGHASSTNISKNS